MSKSEKASATFVGFANLPNQVFRKAVKRGFQFSLMVVGQSGLGKSTLINSLFMTDVYEDSTYSDPVVRMPKTTQVRASTIKIQEGGVRLELTVVDTPGFGDIVDNSNCWQPIISFIDSKYEEYLNEESRVVRGRLEDHRIHCCLYFIAPGHGLKSIDIEFMKRLHEKVNIIPVIAKADTLTPEECARFKKTVMQEIIENGIKIYSFPDTEGDEEEAAANRKLRETIPFAVVGSNAVVEVNNKKVRGRLYPWGVVEVENMEHCDFVTLRNMLISTHMQGLKDVTNNVHYENFRCQKLAGVSGVVTQDPKKFQAPSRDPLAQFEVEKREHEIKMKKMEQEMEQVFEMKVQEKLQKLKDIEADLNRRKEQMHRALEQQQKELNEKRKQFDDDKRHFDQEHQRYMEELEISMRAAKDTKKGKRK